MFNKKDYISLIECSTILKISQGHTKSYVESYGKKVLKIDNLLHISREDLDDIVRQNIEIEKNYISLREAATILNMKVNSLESAIKKEYFKSQKMHKGKIIISKKEVEEARKEKEYYFENYYTDEDIRRIYKRKNTTGRVEEFGAIDCPLIMYGDLTINKKIQMLYLKKSVDEYFEKKYIKSSAYQKNKPQNIEDIFTSIPTNNKEKYLNTYEIYNDYTRIKISTSNASKITKEKYVRELFSSFENYCSVSEKKEIFELSNEDLIKLLNLIQNETSRKHIYAVAEYTSRKRICKYDLKKIKNPNAHKNKKANKEIYSFEQFLELYNYINDYPIHIENAVNNYNYANVWLYLYMHLNNAWRHSDILNIAPIQSEMLGIKSFEDIFNTEINLPNSQMFLNNISTLNMKISKTGMDKNFFFSKDLSIGISYAMIICELHRRKRKNPKLIFFNNTGKISKPYFGLFLERSEKLKNLNFSSLKMNRSLMEHLFYSIQKQEGEGNSAFEMVKKIRNHKTEITKEYITFSEKSTELSVDLFDRGEFGYIYSELINVVTNNKKIETEEKTKMIKEIKEKLSPSQVESTFAILNKFENEKESIINKIYSMDNETAFEYIRKIYLKEMPSKMENVQCLSFPSCHAKNCEYSCFTCPFAIPNAYSMNSLKIDIMERVEKIINAKTQGTIKKENRFLNESLDMLAQAILDFGEDYVWSFFENGEETLEKELLKIE